ncbi:MAG: hypothetical protein AVDCRST_MAG89-2680, partial [uncultured Gemmatimonadetes bacterium]
GNAEHQELAGPALRGAQGEGRVGAPVRRTGGDPPPHAGTCRTGTALDPGSPGAWEGTLVRDRCCPPCRKRARLVGL